MHDRVNHFPSINLFLGIRSLALPFFAIVLPAHLCSILSSPTNTNLSQYPLPTTKSFQIIQEKTNFIMENQPTRLPWLTRLATLARAAETDPEPVQPAQPAPAPPARQPTLPVTRVPLVPQPGPQPRVPAPLQPSIRPPLPPPTAQPIQPAPRPVAPPQPTPRPVTPPQPTPRPVTPPQQDIPKPVQATAPSPPPSPKVIKTSIPTPPPSPRVVAAPASPRVTASVPPPSSPRVTAVPQPASPRVSNIKSANPEAEINPMPQLSRLKTVAMQDEKDNRANGNGDSYKNANTTNGAYAIADTGSKMNGATYNNGNKISNGGNGKSTPSDISHNNTNLTPHPERKEIDNARGTLEERAKHQHAHWGSAIPHSHHKKSETGMKVITIAGENTGAFMELGHNVHGLGRKMPQGGHSLTTGTGSQDGKVTESKDNNKGVARGKPMTSLVNSNVQSINNSLLFNSSCTQKSPGVHLVFKSKTKGKAHKPSVDSPSS